MEAEKLDPNGSRQRVVSTTTITTTTSASINSSKTTAIISNQSFNENENVLQLITDSSDVVISAQQLISGCQIYRMSSRPRGFCCIINNVDFLDNQYPRRQGSDEEALRLSQVFAQLYFEVIVKRNLGQREIMKFLYSTAKHSDLLKHDCLIVIILSHGHSGHIYTADNRSLSFDHILSLFNNENCPNLIAKPKLFFFNCCRGPHIDFGPEIITDNDGPDLDVTDAALWPHVPIVSDMMICFSTIDGYVSWRNELNGTWFGSALQTAIVNYSCQCDLNQLLTIASDIVHKRSTRHGAKQAIEWKYLAWTKSLYFNPGLYAQ